MEETTSHFFSWLLLSLPLSTSLIYSFFQQMFLSLWKAFCIHPSQQPTECDASVVFLGSAPLNSSWSELLKRTKAKEKEQFGYWKEKNLIIWEGVEKLARFQMGGGSKCLGKGGGGPCAHWSSWVLRRIKDHSVMTTKGLLCIHSQGPAGVMNSLSPGARLEWL